MLSFILVWLFTIPFEAWGLYYNVIFGDIRLEVAFDFVTLWRIGSLTLKSSYSTSSRSLLYSWRGLTCVPVWSSWSILDFYDFWSTELEATATLVSTSKAVAPFMSIVSWRSNGSWNCSSLRVADLRLPDFSVRPRSVDSFSAFSVLCWSSSSTTSLVSFLTTWMLPISTSLHLSPYSIWNESRSALLLLAAVSWFITAGCLATALFTDLDLFLVDGVACGLWFTLLPSRMWMYCFCKPVFLNCRIFFWYAPRLGIINDYRFRRRGLICVSPFIKRVAFFCWLSKTVF